jgi:hypothetical protein
MTLPPFWRQRLLAVLGAPANPENLRFLDAWERAEGPTADNNPLHTTYVLPWGSHDFNSSRVQNYTQPTAGICATALTIATSHTGGKLTYGGILADLQSGSRTAEEIVQRNTAEIHTWGTNPDLILKLLAEGRS